MTMSYAKALIAAVGDTEIPPDQENPEREFAKVMFSLLAAALAKLSLQEREELLDFIEGGGLRPAIAKYPNARLQAGAGGASGHLN